MAVFHTLNKKTMIAMMIAATGLSTSIAAAQFKVDYTAKAESAPEVKTEKSVLVYRNNDDEHSYEIKIINGEVVFAKVDGNEVGDDQIKIDGEVVVFISEDGKTLHEIKLPKSPEVVDGVFPKKQWKVKMGTPLVLDADDLRNFRVQFAGEPDENGYFTMQGTATQPKVMLGINLGEPSKILRKHLKLKEGMHAILVERVIEGLPAQAAGVQEFDVIISIDGSDEASGESLGKILAEKEAGDTMKMIVLRSGSKIKLKVKLAEYNAQALSGRIYYDDMEGYEEIKEKLEAEKNALDIEWELLTKFENGEFGHIQSEHLANLKDLLHGHLTKTADQHGIAIELRAKAMDAMKQAERQMVEFQDGRLTVRSTPEISGRIQRLEIQRLDRMLPQAMDKHMDGMEARLAALESRIDHQMDEMGEQMDRLMSMFERLMDRLEDDDD